MEEFGICPFNKSHSIERSKLITHINRCKDKKNFPNEKLHRCNKDSSYHLDRERIAHLEQCEICIKPKVDESINVSFINNSIGNPHQLGITMISNLDTSEISFNEHSFITFDEKKQNSNIY
jgi:hypothetical protein